MAQLAFPRLRRRIYLLWATAARNETALVFWAVLLFVPAALTVIWVVPQWQVAGIPEAALDRHSAKYFELQNEARRTIAQAILGAFSAFALFLAWRRVRTADGTLRIAEQGHITDRFTKAIEQLSATEDGRPVIEIRIGAIYALERISIDSARDYWSIINILSEYLCQHAKPENLQTTDFKTLLNTTFLRADIAAALRVLGRRRDPSRQYGIRLQLSNCCISGTTIAADFLRSDILNCDFSNNHFVIPTDFSESNFGRVDFKGCGFHSTKFDRTRQFIVVYRDSTFENVSFADASLAHVDFRNTRFESVDFNRATMDTVNLASSDLSKASGLTPEMLEGTIGDGKTLLPAGMEHPKSWTSDAAKRMALAIDFIRPLTSRSADNPAATIYSSTGGRQIVTVTKLLFPFVTNRAGFDTGIAITNISADPFGSEEGEGTCSVYFYGDTTEGGPTPEPQTSAVIQAGGQLTFTLAGGGTGGLVAVPGFQGYVVAECRFKAAGLAHLSNLGGQGVGTCYKAQTL